jgi:hypothetical protein
LFISTVRLGFTVFPLKSMIVVCNFTTKRVNIFLFCCSILIILTKMPSLLKLKISECSGLLKCEIPDTDSLKNMSSAQIAICVGSLLICFSILTEILVIWLIASAQVNQTEHGCQVTVNASQNYKAVQTCLAMASVFLLCNSGAMVNNILKLLAVPLQEGPLLEQLSGAYFIADTLEQWLLPIMTVANCIVYTATSKKIQHFCAWYCRNMFKLEGSGSRYRYQTPRVLVIGSRERVVVSGPPGARWCPVGARRCPVGQQGGPQLTDREDPNCLIFGQL